MYTLIRYKEKSMCSFQYVQKEKYDKIQHCFMIKTFYTVGVKGNFLNLIKVIHKNSRVTILLKGKSLNIFFLKVEIRHKCILSSFTFIYWRLHLRQLGKKIKKKSSGKERCKIISICQ